MKGTYSFLHGTGPLLTGGQRSAATVDNSQAHGNASAGSVNGVVQTMSVSMCDVRCACRRFVIDNGFSKLKQLQLTCCRAVYRRNFRGVANFRAALVVASVLDARAY